MKYHVTQNWNGKDLKTAADFMGEEEAIEMFCEKWNTDDTSYAQDQIRKIYLYATIEEAQEHQDIYGGEILAINDEWLDIFEDWTEGVSILATRNTIKASDISRI